MSRTSYSYRHDLKSFNKCLSALLQLKKTDPHVTCMMVHVHVVTTVEEKILHICTYTSSLGSTCTRPLDHKLRKYSSLKLDSKYLEFDVTHFLMILDRYEQYNYTCKHKINFLIHYRNYLSSYTSLKFLPTGLQNILILLSWGQVQCLLHAFSGTV